MRCPFCFTDNNSGETCRTCGSPLHGLPPQKSAAKQSSTRLDAPPLNAPLQLPQRRAVLPNLPKPTKPQQNNSLEQSEPQELQLIARRKVDETLLCAAFWSQQSQEETVALMTSNGALQFWNLQRDTLQLVSAPRTKKIFRCSMASFDAAHERVVLAFDDGRLELVEALHGASSTRLLTKGAVATSLAMASEAEVLAVASEDGTIALWDLKSPQKAPAITLELCGLHRVAIAPNATWLVCGNESGQVQMWNMQALQMTSQPQWSFEAHHLWVSSVAFSPNAQMLASGGYDGTVRLYASQNGFELAQFPAAGENADFGAVTALCFADNRSVVIGFAQGTLARLDSWTGTTTSLAHLAAPVLHLTASRDGSSIIALCGNEVLLWRLPIWRLPTFPLP